MKEEDFEKVLDVNLKGTFLVTQTAASFMKEQELQEMASQIAELKAAQAPSTAALRNTLIDPAVNLVIQRLTKECDSLKKQAEEARDELAAWKFTPDSATGKRLMAKCRQLYQENEDLGEPFVHHCLQNVEIKFCLSINGF